MFNIRKLSNCRNRFLYSIQTTYFLCRKTETNLWKPINEMPQDWFHLKICHFLPLLCISVNLLLPFSVMAFEVKTHRQITEKAIEGVESTLHAYLTENLGLEGGLNASVGGMTAKEWMIQGSEFEDEDGFTRPLNHFHDPISGTGLTGLGESAIDWSLQAVGEQKYSWNDAREYYFKALTSLTKAERDVYWGKTFRALGQIMHLIQDMASPAHVRNDPHLSYFGIGNVDGLHDYMDRQSVASYLGGGKIGPDSSMLEQAGATRQEPFSNLFDTNQYTGSNPDATLGGHVGLAEYANVNFFSDDTIPFQPLINFPSYNHPGLSELVPATSPFPSSEQYLTLLRLGSPADTKSRVAKYTGNQALAKFTLAHLQYDLIGQLQLDDAVYDAYSSHLIPRAVGYSAAVLDYFFRGGVEVISTDFIITATNQEGGCAPIPSEEFGNLLVKVEIPSDLGFVGTVSLYYDRSNGTRVLGEQVTNPQPRQQLWLGATVLHAEIPNPVRWYVVLEGQAGPGTPEPRAVIAKSDLVDWFFGCLG